MRKLIQISPHDLIPSAWIWKFLIILDVWDGNATISIGFYPDYETPTWEKEIKLPKWIGRFLWERW